jgi:IclR family transcriptional regulator, pca regulon regulatory protein
MKEESSLYFSKSFEKGLKILSLFNPDRRSLSLKEVSEMIGANKSSAYRFVNTLVKLDFLKKDARTKLLTLAPKSYLLGLNLSRSFSLLQVVKPIIDKVCDAYQISIDSALLSGSTLLKLYQRIAPDMVTYQSSVVDPATHSHALGKATLAFLPDGEMREIVDQIPLIKRTENTLTTKKDFLADLKKTRERGYAINNEEFVLGMFALAVPFFSRETARPIGAVSIDFSTAQHTVKEAREKYLDVLLKLGEDISRVV